MRRIKLAALAVVCGILIGCDRSPRTPPLYHLGDSVLIHNSIPAQVLKRTYWSNDTYTYKVLLDGGAVAGFPEERLSLKNENRKLCLTTRTEMGIFHPCSQKEHNLKQTN